MPKQTLVKKHFAPLRVGITLVLLAAAIYILTTHWQTVRNSLAIAHTARPLWLFIALLLMALTFTLAAAIYGALALRSLRYKQTILVEIASAFANRLVPAGLGGLGLHGVYLFKRKHTTSQATAIVSVNNLIGISAHLLLLISLWVVRPQSLRQFAQHISLPHLPQYVLGAIMLLAVLLTLSKVRRFLSNLFVSLRLLAPHKVIIAFCLAVCLTAAYTLCLWSVAHSLGIRLDVLQVFVVFSIGMLLGTATPTPGGLVGAEAGLYAGFVSYGVTAPHAGAVVLVYRLLTYWLPLLPGVGALLVARKTKLL